MNSLTFTVAFHSPFAVATGVARDGLDLTIDAANPLPSTAIKGLLRAHLRDSLHAPAALERRIFHGGDSPRWVFGDGRVSASVNEWVRVSVDADGRAEERYLMVGQQAHARTATFAVTWEDAGDPPADEVLALRAAARCVTSLGSHRRRGLGWVTIVDREPWTEADSVRLLRVLRPEGSVA